MSDKANNEDGRMKKVKNGYEVKIMNAKSKKPKKKKDGKESDTIRAEGNR